MCSSQNGIRIFCCSGTKRFKEVWRTDLTAGVNSMVQKNSYDYSFADGLSIPGVYNLGNAASNVAVTQRDSKKRINSVLFTGQLSYRDYLFLNVTARNDWSSALTRSDGAGHNSYFYPSISASAVLSDIWRLPKKDYILVGQRRICRGGK